MNDLEHADTVSVVIPTHNRREGLVSALESLARQTVRPDQVIVIDDGSVDSVQEDVRKFQDLNILYLRNDVPKGGNYSRNRGIEASSSYYVAFLDDDDEFVKTKIAFIKEWIRSYPAVHLFYHPALIKLRREDRTYVSSAECCGEDPLNRLLVKNIVGGTLC